MNMNGQDPSYSPEIRLDFQINGKSWELAEIGPDFFTIRNPLDLPPCEGVVVMQVDGRETRWPVFLMDGISKDSDIVRFAE